jgi:hypothetical protein
MVRRRHFGERILDGAAFTSSPGHEQRGPAKTPAAPAANDQ